MSYAPARVYVSRPGRWNRARYEVVGHVVEKLNVATGTDRLVRTAPVLQRAIENSISTGRRIPGLCRRSSSGHRVRRPSGSAGRTGSMVRLSARARAAGSCPRPVFPAHLASGHAVDQGPRTSPQDLHPLLHQRLRTTMDVSDLNQAPAAVPRSTVGPTPLYSYTPAAQRSLTLRLASCRWQPRRLPRLEAGRAWQHAGAVLRLRPPPVLKRGLLPGLAEPSVGRRRVAAAHPRSLC